MVVGDAEVGKTTLLHCFASKGFTNPYIIPVFDDYPMELPPEQSGDNKINLYLTDARGLDRHKTLRLHSYRGKHVFLICFSIANKNTLRNAKRIWLKEIRQQAPDAPVILVGTKGDLRGTARNAAGRSRLRLVSSKKAKDKAKAMGAYAYIECSANTQYNVEALFKLAVDAAVASQGEERTLKKRRICGCF
ncbi:hypothetical protein SprV_0401469900 [Sparganum proliferum]